MPQFVSIEEARKKLGGISRTTFYVTVLPLLEAFASQCDRPAATKKLGRRRMVYLSVLEAFMLSKLWWFTTILTAIHLFRWNPNIPGPIWPT